MKTLLNSLAVAGALAIAPVASHAALTLELESGASIVSIADNGAGDISGSLGRIIAEDIAVGGALVDITSTVAKDENGESSLKLNVTDAVVGITNLIIRATFTDFGVGASQPSNLSFTTNASNLTGMITGEAFVDDGAAEFGTTTQIGSTVSFTSDGIVIKEFGSASLTDPFSMSIFTTLSANTIATFDATAIATVPVPSAGLLLLTALGGAAMAYRRRKT